MSNEFEAICRRVQAAPPSRLRNDALDLIGAQRAQAMLTVEMAATAQAAQNECAALRRDLDTMRQRAEAAEREIAVLRTSTEAAAVVYLRAELEQTRTERNIMAREAAAATARAEAAEAKLARVDQYAAYYNTVASKGDAPETFTDWLGGAANWSHYRSEVQ